jgi:predicted nucleic acid-binding protein
MKVLVDTNVLLDVLGNREPFYAAAAEIWSLAERREIKAYISSVSFNNVYYIVRKAENRAKADKAIRILRDVFEPVAPDSQIINQAIDMGLDDFEDAVQFCSAIRVKAACLVTRDPGDFPRTAGLSILSPEEFLVILRSRKS